MNRRHQAGVALLTVLLLVAVMSALLVLVLDDIRFGQRRAGNAAGHAQAQWFALGAEAFAAAQLQQAWRATPGRTPAALLAAGEPLVFPLEHGLVQARLRDRTTCFNLNGLVEGAGDLLQRREAGVRQFRALLEALDVPAPRAESLADALADWTDADSEPAGRGGEDASYLAGTVPHRTGNTLLAEASELRAVRGFDAAVYARLRPHVCALPVAGPAPLNLDALDEDDALQLVALSEGRLKPAAARQVLRRRPPGGWPDVATFWRQPELRAALPDPVTLERSTLRSRYLQLDARVRHLEAEVVLTSLLEVDDAGRCRTLARRWSPEE